MLGVFINNAAFRGDKVNLINNIKGHISSGTTTPQ